MSTETTRRVVTAAPSEEEPFSYRLMAESIPHLAWRARPDGFITWYNQRWYEYTGTTPSDMEGWGWRSVHHPDTVDEVVAAFTASIEAGKAFDMTFPLRGVDGVFRPFLTRAVPARDAAGKVLHWFGTNTDVTEQVRVAADLKRQQELLEVAQLSNEIGFWSFSIDEAGLYLSAGARRLMNLPREGLVSAQQALGSVVEEDVPPLRAAMQQALVDGHCRVEFQTRTAQGEETRWLQAATKILGEPGQRGHYVGVLMDVTHQKRSNDALLRAEKLTVAGRLAATIAHEINNPLESVTNLLYLLEQTDLTEEQRGYCAVAASELRRVSEIANHTLRFHRQASGAALFSLRAMVESVLALFEGRLRSAHVEVRVRIVAGLTMCGYEGELRQVVANLVGNAIDALAGRPGRKTLQVRGRAGADGAGRRGVVLTVADTGAGISAETAARLFEPFYTTKGPVGTGLGLWVSREIVSKHHGSLTMRSSQVAGHEGTVFRMFAPDATPGSE